MVSLTVVSFLFGGLLAVQLRAIDRVRADREKQVENAEAVKAQAAMMAKRIKEEEEAGRKLRARLAALNSQLKQSDTVSKTTLAKLNTQMNELQTLAGLSKVSGPGIVMIVDDNPEAAKEAGGNASSFLPGIVHDFDLLQIVNELRGAKAEAISVKGHRITAYTPIRCVGPNIQINFEPVTPPFRIEAIGDPDTLAASLNLPGGIVDNLRNPAAGPGLQIKISKVDSLSLPASNTVPTVRVAQADKTTPAP
jgi:uncharacterized protein YlxW (UPF0749 family)